MLGLTCCRCLPQANLTPFAKQCLTEMAPKYSIEVFQEQELLINITKHVLVPQHQVSIRIPSLPSYRRHGSDTPRLYLTWLHCDLSSGARMPWIPFLSSPFRWDIDSTVLHGNWPMYGTCCVIVVCCATSELSLPSCILHCMCALIHSL